MKAELAWTRKAGAKLAKEPPLEYLDELFRYAYAVLGNREDAEDVAVEVCAAALGKKLPEDPHEKRLYLVGMARRKVIDRLRMRNRTPRPWTAEPDLGDLHHAVHATLGKLIPEHREVLALKYLHGFTAEEIGRQMRKSVAAVNSLLQRARQSFETASGGAFDDDRGVQ